MPELPEVETVRRGLEPALAGRLIRRAEVRRPDLRWPLPPGLAARLTGARAIALRRRSKYLLIDLDGGATLLVHLGMSGRMILEAPRPSAEPDAPLGRFVHPVRPLAQHDHVVLELEDGGRIAFNDPRRFGAMDLWPTAALEAHPRLAGLGPEPLGDAFDASYLRGRLAGRGAAIKAALLDQAVVAGLGNIYVCEALWRAGLSPLRPSGEVSGGEAGRLVAAIRAVLLEAIEAGGSSLRDHRRVDGGLGYFQHAFAVYGRAGQPCLRPGCGGAVLRLVQSGRSSFHCPRCQAADPRSCRPSGNQV
jgi:formamidopyrimidine-DNA glycosylase